ncbi:MAG: transglutaminase domain-containing protein [Bacteroidota bacterium]
MTSILRNIVFVIFVLALVTGCSVQHEPKNIAEAGKLLTNGQLTQATAMANDLLKSHQLSGKEKRELDSILEMCVRIRRDFKLSEQDVLQKLSKYNPQIDSTELKRLEKEGKMDLLTINGKRTYFSSSVRNLFLLDTAYARLRAQKEGSSIDSFTIFKLKHTASVLANSNHSGEPVNPVKMKLSYTICVNADAVPAGETLRCWMPYPRENHQRQQAVHLIQTDPATNQISPVTDLQRTVYLEKIAVANQPTIFHTEIEIIAAAQSFQLSPEMIVPYQKESPLYKEFTAEKAPQIIFNAKIKSLAKNILQGETNPLLQVKKIYTWINDSVTWASALEYSIMPDIPGFVMEKRHGDCGMQTLLFMTLARSVGIPVKWQSGWMLHPGEVNLHDWCEVYYEEVGWVPLDQSFGLQNSEDERERYFYMTGIDSYRMIVNDDFSKPLTPIKKYFRSEPYDFQRGEIEWKGGNLYFDKWSWHMEVTYE